MNRRCVLHALSLVGLAPLATGTAPRSGAPPLPRSSPSRLLINADTANETDDLYTSIDEAAMRADWWDTAYAAIHADAPASTDPNR